MQSLILFLWGMLGVLLYLFIDGGALDRATPTLSKWQAVRKFWDINWKYIAVCVILIFVVSQIGGQLPFLPEQYKFNPENDNRGLMFMIGLGIQVLLLALRRWINPQEIKVTPTEKNQL